MIETKLEINDKIGYLLFKKGIIDASTLDKALNAKFNDRNKLKRNLAQILVDDFKYEHDVIFREVAILYAFRELDIDLQTIQPNQLDSIRSIVESGGEELKEIMLKENIIPFMYDEQIKDKLIIASTDPTNKNVQKVAFGLNAKKTEVIFIKKKDYDQLIEKLFPPENKFLQNISDDYENLIPTEEREDLDEDELDAEINKSALINLVEGALVEAVRKGASDIHFIPGSGHRTEIYMRIDGTLRLWHV
ncbi:MAG: type II/IV secretion system protein, partial [Ignavibacteriaceae bacterium]|nr:type II/IV secretion system protein [Ignavibacteriaceae bacterium]